MLNLYMTGDADWITDVPRSAVPTLLARFGPEGTGEFLPSLQLGTYYFRLNTRKPPLTSPAIRRALSLAIDRDEIVREITRAGEVAARSFVPPGVAAYEPATVALCDPDEARVLFRKGLTELGLETPPTVEILFNTSPEHQAIAELIQDRWRNLFGLETRLTNQDWGSFQSALRTGDYTVGRSSWFGDYNDASSFLELYLSGAANNQTGFADPAYDALVLRARSMPAGAERAAVLREAEQLLLEAAPIIPIYHYVTTHIVKPHVRGFHHNIMDRHPLTFLQIAR
jgi:oligopeptide transport system substrate-binding protein